MKLWRNVPFHDKYEQTDFNETLRNVNADHSADDSLLNDKMWEVFKNKGINFIHLNINSLYNKIDDNPKLQSFCFWHYWNQT